jgi:hypothetical protein
MTSENDVLTSILTFFHQKSVAALPCHHFPLLTGFTAITDHPSKKEVLPGHGPQCGGVPGNIPISFWSWVT